MPKTRGVTPPKYESESTAMDEKEEVINTLKNVQHTQKTRTLQNE